MNKLSFAFLFIILVLVASNAICLYKLNISPRDFSLETSKPISAPIQYTLPENLRILIERDKVMIQSKRDECAGEIKILEMKGNTNDKISDFRYDIQELEKIISNLDQLLITGK